MGATVVLVCASHSTSHFTLQSQLSELPRRSLHHEGDGGGTEGAGSQLLCPPGPSGFSVDTGKAAAGCSCGIFVPVRERSPTGWVQPRGHVLDQESTG